MPKGLSWEAAAASEPVAAAYNGIQRAKIKPGDDVVILGGGPIGLYHTQLAKLAGAGQVIVSEPPQRAVSRPRPWAPTRWSTHRPPTRRRPSST